MRNKLTNQEIVMLRNRQYTFTEIAEEAGFSKQRARFIYHRDKDKFDGSKPDNFFWRLVANLKRMFL